MKRLWVQPQFKGSGIGRQLAGLALEFATSAGYSQMVLDTLERLTSANKLYANLGFSKCEPYYANPLPQVVYWSKALAQDA